MSGISRVSEGRGARANIEALERQGFKFSKAMGQNFLIDANIPEKIVRLSGINKSCGVLEVGPGIGALTVFLSEAAGKVTAVELDERVIPILHERFDANNANNNVDIVHEDVLKLNLAEFVKEKMPNMKYCVCANLPYNITSPALAAFIDADVFEFITVMVQREVAKRICAKPGSSDYGAFTVYANYYTEPKMLFDVPPECFIPRPKVTSSVITLTTRAECLLASEDEKRFFKVVRAAFGQRRKTLVNALFAVFSRTMSKDEITEIVVKCGFDPRVRGETLGIGEFIDLAKYF